MSKEPPPKRRSGRKKETTHRWGDEGLPVPDHCDKRTTPTQTKAKNNPTNLKTNPGGTKKKKADIARMNVDLQKAAKLGTKGMTNQQIVQSLNTTTEKVSSFWNCIQRDKILQAADGEKISSRDNLLLFRILQDDTAFNKTIASNDKSTCRSYSGKQRDAMVKSVSELHKRYYGVTLYADARDLHKKVVGTVNVCFAVAVEYASFIFKTIHLTKRKKTGVRWKLRLTMIKKNVIRN